MPGGGAPAAATAQAAPVSSAPPADAWGSPAPAAPTNNGWGAPAAPAPAPSASGQPPANAWGAAPAVAAQDTNNAWGNAPEGSANATPTDAWGAAPASVGSLPAPTGAPAAEPANGIAAQYSTIPPGQFATPANAGTAIASSGWGGSTVPPSLDAAQIEAKKNTWAAEAEQLETGTWRAFAPKMGEAMGAKAPAMPVAGPTPTAAASGDRWDVPIQERAKTQGDQPAPFNGMPIPAVPPPITPIQPPAPANAQARWDVPIQERARAEAEAPQAPQAVPAQAMGMGTPMGMPPGICWLTCLIIRHTRKSNC